MAGVKPALPRAKWPVAHMAGVKPALPRTAAWVIRKFVTGPFTEIPRSTRNDIHSGKEHPVIPNEAACPTPAGRISVQTPSLLCFRHFPSFRDLNLFRISRFGFRIFLFAFFALYPAYCMSATRLTQ